MVPRSISMSNFVLVHTILPLEVGFDNYVNDVRREKTSIKCEHKINVTFATLVEVVIYNGYNCFIELLKSFPEIPRLSKLDCF